MPKNRPIQSAAVTAITMLAVCLLDGSLHADDLSYLEDVKPLLKVKCYACHGPLKQESDLRLDTGELARTGGAGGAVVVPGEPTDSELLRRVTSPDLEERMPPDGEPLTDAQVELLRRWIAAGAPSPADEEPQTDPQDHWAYQPLREPEKESTIDGLIAARLAAAGLDPNPPAERRTLIRRLFLDMHGLPPTPEQVQSFVDSAEPDAWEKLVDEVLASPRYGERWAQHWLDVVRYADTHGFEVNTPRDHAWPYRDYVIDAFNRDLPYDQFILDQLAGDARNADAATGFLVAAAVLLPGQIGQDDASKRQARQDELDEMIIGTTATFLGMTVGCARCHDHKFDPVSQRDYYALQAFFAGVDYGDRPIHDAEFARRQAESGRLRPRLVELSARLLPLEWLRYPIRFVSLREEYDLLVSEFLRLNQPRLVYGGSFREPDETWLLSRGDPEQRLEAVGPQVPELFGSSPLDSSTSEQDRRIALARWIASPDNPLTARVMVNRIWQYHFGTGLVETASDFGLNSASPSHPDLLDWLARELIASGWSIKHIHRLILNSQTYQRSGEVNSRAANVDAGDRLLWRFPTRRLEAEAIRDSILAVSGQLNFETGGPGFDFFESRGGLSGFPPVTEFGPEKKRRMIYAHKIRMESVPVFGAFDCPDAGQPMPTRSRSTTALQALNLFNSPFLIDQSEQFARRVEQEIGNDDESRVVAAFQHALSRDPTPDELGAVLPVVGEHGLATLCRVLFNSNEFLFLP